MGLGTGTRGWGWARGAGERLGSCGGIGGIWAGSLVGSELGPSWDLGGIQAGSRQDVGRILAGIWDGSGWDLGWVLARIWTSFHLGSARPLMLLGDSLL